MATRRGVLLASGGAAAFVFGGLIYRSYQQGIIGGRLEGAFAPWSAFDPHGRDGAWSLIRAAVLAVSPHNTQPWLFRIRGDSIEILADRARNLGAFDPFRREMQIGLGAAIENMVIAASCQGLKTEVDVVPGPLEADPADDLVAIADLTFGPQPAENPDPLGEAIIHRHTNRGAYDLAREIPADVVESWGETAKAQGVDFLTFGRDPPRAEIDRLIVSSTERIIGDPAMMAASDRWFRLTGDEILRRRDGLIIEAQGLPPMTSAAARMLPAVSPEKAAQFWLERTREVQLPSAPLIGILKIQDRFDQAQSIAVGRVWQRIALRAAARGIATQPINQIPECMDRERQLKQDPKTRDALQSLIGPAEGATFFFRAGWPRGVAELSPRRAAEEVVLRQA